MRKGTQLRFEPLEERLAMSATIGAGLANGVLTITGTQGDDQVTIERRGDRLHVVQAEEWFKAKGVQQIAIDLGDGDDTVRITSPNRSYKSFGEATTISAGDGNEQFTGPNGNKLYFGGDDALLSFNRAG